MGGSEGVGGYRSDGPGASRAESLADGDRPYPPRRLVVDDDDLGTGLGREGVLGAVPEPRATQPSGREGRAVVAKVRVSPGRRHQLAAMVGIDGLARPSHRIAGRQAVKKVIVVQDHFHHHIVAYRLGGGASRIDLRTHCSARDDGYRPAGGHDEREDVTGVAGQDAISCCGHGHHARVCSVGHAGLTEQDARLSAQVVVDGLDVDGLEQVGKIRLSSGRVAPHLGDHDASGA